MGTKNYITAIEIGSSKVAGTVGVATYEGINIIAYASEPVDGFISKGVVRNVDAASACLTNIINRLEAQLDNKVTIEKAYTTIGGISVRSVKSTVKREFDEYKKITPEIIDAMAIENDNEFVVPEGYQKVQVIVQDYKLDGSVNTAPAGFHTRSIEGSYLNIIINEQFMKQLGESFEMAKIEIVDSFTAAKLEADILLNKDDKHSCALVNMGAETTTISIYTNELLRKLVVLPLGGENITRDISTQHISREEAESIKIFKGYGATGSDNSLIANENLNKIIAARIEEILLNIKHQIESSGEKVGHIFFTGGAAKLKNLKTLLDEHLQDYTTRIITEPTLRCFNDSGLSLASDAITPTLFGLLSTGKENCCREVGAKEPATPVQLSLLENVEEDKNEPETAATATEEKAEVKTEEKDSKKTEKSRKKPKWQQTLINMFADFKDNMTEDEENDDE
ncbi:MAG: pilus assembly protein PilM [Bacteroidaceae bacterium]|nr:pilus assembly protein PilM [Bacteroidaceae bacterium]